MNKFTKKTDMTKEKKTTYVQNFLTDYPLGSYGRLHYAQIETGEKRASRRRIHTDTLEEGINKDLLEKLRSMIRGFLSQLNAHAPRDKDGTITYPFIFDELYYQEKTSKNKATLGFTFYRLNQFMLLETVIVSFELRNHAEEYVILDVEADWLDSITTIYRKISDDKLGGGVESFTVVPTDYDLTTCEEITYSNLYELSFRINTLPNICPTYTDLRLPDSEKEIGTIYVLNMLRSRAVTNYDKLLKGYDDGTNWLHTEKESNFNVSLSKQFVSTEDIKKLIKSEDSKLKENPASYTVSD